MCWPAAWLLWIGMLITVPFHHWYPTTPKTEDRLLGPGTFERLVCVTTTTTTIAMAVPPRPTEAARLSPSRRSQKQDDDAAAHNHNNNKQELILEHLPPLPLVLVVLFCSGALLIFALRDFMTTGRNIGGAWDEAMLVSSFFCAH